MNKEGIKEENNSSLFTLLLFLNFRIRRIKKKKSLCEFSHGSIWIIRNRGVSRID